MSKIFRAAAFVTASAVCLTMSADGIAAIIGSRNTPAVVETAVPEISVLSNTTSADPETAAAELLVNACLENDKEEITELCDELSERIVENKEDMQKISRELEEWGNQEAIARQIKYESEMNIKSAETLAALGNVRKGVDTEKNLEIITENLNQSDESKKSDAVPNTAVAIDDVRMTAVSSEEEGTEILSPPPTPDDLAYDAGTQFPEAIKEAADSMEDINSVYLFVKNNIAYESYSGSKKGAAATLDQLGGNDADQASLLVALLRAKGVPARYMNGTIMITAEQAVDITGAADAASAGRILSARYKNVTGITRNGSLIGYRMSHTWVEAYIPYTDYRGAGEKNGENIWVQLDPSFKKLVIDDQEVTADFSNDSSGLLYELYSTAEKYPNIFSDYDNSGSAVYHYRYIEKCEDKYIPSSLPYTVVSVESRSSFISESSKDKLTIAINGEVLLNADVADLYCKQINVSYEPADDTDRAIMERYGNITEVPAYLVNVVPVVTAGDKKYRGSWEAALGSSQQMITTIRNNGGTTMLDDTVYCGSMYSFTLDLQSISSGEIMAAENRLTRSSEDLTPENLCTPEKLGTVLDYAGKYYFSLCDSNAVFCSGLMNINRTRQLGLAITGYQFGRSSSFGVIRSLEDGSFYIDVAYNSVAAVSRDGDKDAERNYMMTTGYIESYLEGYIWEQLVDKSKVCISTASVFGIAGDQGIGLRFISSGNLEEELAQCNVSDAVKNEVRNFVNRGLVVEIVPETLTIGDWTGTGYIALNLSNGSASYMISGGNAGGSSMKLSFEEMFNVNMILANINMKLSLASMAMGTISLETGVLSNNPAKMIEGVHSTIGSAFSLSSAMKMRYDTMDFIFKYVEQGEGCMEEFGFQTFRNLVDTVVNLQSFIGGIVGEELGIATDIIAAVNSLSWYVYDLENGSADVLSTVSIIWDFIGKLL